jgi:sporulation protein YlmC with PRC-barrel domain
MDADSLKGMAVVSISEATRLGTVTDLVFETQPLRIGAVQAAGKDSEFVIPFEQVRTIGPDAVMVESSQVTQIAGGGSVLGELIGLADMRRLKVVDESGTLLGTVQAVELDPVTGHVIRLQARKGGVLGVGADTTAIDAASIRSVGSEVLTVGEGGKA